MKCKAGITVALCMFYKACLNLDKTTLTSSDLNRKKILWDKNKIVNFFWCPYELIIKKIETLSKSRNFSVIRKTKKDLCPKKRKKSELIFIYDCVMCNVVARASFATVKLKNRSCLDPSTNIFPSSPVTLHPTALLLLFTSSTVRS